MCVSELLKKNKMDSRGPAAATLNCTLTTVTPVPSMNVWFVVPVLKGRSNKRRKTMEKGLVNQESGPL